MRWLAAGRERVRALLFAARQETEMDEELRFHLEQETELLLQAGLDPREARRQARVRFGGMNRVKDEVREERGIGAVDDLRADLRVAVRVWARRPAFALVVVATLALGIGANVAVFSVIDGVLLRPLPYPEPDRLGVIYTELPRQERGRPASSGPELVAFRDDTTAFSSVGGIWYRPAALTDDASPPEDIDMGFVSRGFLQTLGVSPALGRLIAAGEDIPNGPRVVVLSHGLWQRRYGGVPDIVGTTVDMDDVPHTVIGVMPEGFRLLLPPDAGVPEELSAWVPWGGGYDEMRRQRRIFTVVARTAAGVDPRAAQAELSALASSFQSDFPGDYAVSGLALELEPLGRSAVAHVRSTLFLLVGAVGFVFLIACTNIANLMLVRASGAGREMELRVALGATRSRLVRQLAAESAVLSIAGAGLGVALARWGGDLLKVVGPAQLPRLGSVAVSAPMLVVALFLGVATAMVFGLVAVLQVSRDGGALRVGTRTAGDAKRQRARRILVAAEVSVSVVLLMGAGLLAHSFTNLANVDPGFDTSGVQTVKLSLVDSHYPYSESARIGEFYHQLVDRLSDVSGVQAAGATSQLPLDGKALELGPYAYDTSEGVVDWESVAANYHAVTPGFLEAMRARLVGGRLFEWLDDLDHPSVVVIDRRLEQTAFPGRSAIGQRLRVDAFVQGESRPVWAQVIGVVEHLRHHPGEDGLGQIYLPHQQSPQRTMALALRTPLGEGVVLELVRKAVAEINPTQPVQNVRAMRTYLADTMAPTRFALAVLGIFAVVAVVIAALGLYGVVSCSAGQRRREFGVRLALGATPRPLRRVVLVEGAALTAVGLGLGLVASFVLGRGLQGQLYGLSAQDPLTVGAIVVLLSVVSLAAVYIPAYRASRVSLTTALGGD
jgi:predicted permease